MTRSNETNVLRVWFGADSLRGDHFALEPWQLREHVRDARARALRCSTRQPVANDNGAASGELSPELRTRMAMKGRLAQITARALGVTGLP